MKQEEEDTSTGVAKGAWDTGWGGSSCFSLWTPIISALPYLGVEGGKAASSALSLTLSPGHLTLWTAGGAPDLGQ